MVRSVKDPSRLQKLDRLSNARDRLKPLLEDPRRWNNECEQVFAEFRVAVVHLRSDRETLDAVDNKEVVWRFLCKLSRDRRPFWGRCEEVLNILKDSDDWVRALVDDPEADVNDLPTNVIKEFDSRCEEVSARCSKHVRLAIIGCGMAAVRHCEILARHNERVKCDFYRIVALVDKAPERIAAIREIPEAAELRLDDADDFAGLEALFGENCDFDAAALLSHADRERILPALLARGKFVIVEPPLVASGVEAANRLAKMSRQPPGSSLQRLLVAEPAEYLPELKSALGHLSAGSIGDVSGAEARCSWGGDEASEILGNGIGCTLVPGLQLMRVLRRLVGPVEEAIATPQGGSAPSSVSRNPNNPFGPPSRELAGPETSSACILRHKGGRVSTLRLQTCGPRLQRGASRASNLTINGSLGDLVVEGSKVFVNADASRTGRRPSPSAKDQREELSPGEHLWELFASQVAPIARGQGDPLGALQLSLQANPQEAADNLEAHLADLAVAEALRSSFRSRRFEAVQAPGLIACGSPHGSPTAAASLWD
jgi:predicted dehydrogenase